MNSAALARLQHMGKLFTVAGAAAQRLGLFMENPAPQEVEECFTYLANCFVEASTVCDTLAELTISQHVAGEGHGYGVADSAALATFKTVLDGFGAPAVYISCMEFTMEGDEKSEAWSHAAVSMRRSAEASWRQINLLGSLLQEQKGVDS